MDARRRAAALLEVLGVYLAGPLVIALLAGLLNLRLSNPLAKFTADISDAELLTASRDMLMLLVLQYAGWFLLIIPINWWHRRRGPAAYGLTLAGRSWTFLVVAGVTTTALAAWPAIAVQLTDSLYNLGDTVPWRQAIFDTSWRRWEFWLFTGVASWAVVPLLEELFYRGYFQRRLAEDWGDGPAIIGTACLFVLSHGQYLMLNGYNLALLASLFILAVAFGVIFAWTRSIVPSVIAHAIINVPMTPLWQGVMLGLLLIGAALSAPRGLMVIRHVFSRTSRVACVALALVGAGYAIAMPRVPYLDYAALGMVLLAIALEAVDRRREPTPTPPSPGRSHFANAASTPASPSGP